MLRSPEPHMDIPIKTRKDFRQEKEISVPDEQVEACLGGGGDEAAASG